MSNEKEVLIEIIRHGLPKTEEAAKALEAQLNAPSKDSKEETPRSTRR